MGQRNEKDIYSALAQFGRILTVLPILAAVFLSVLWYCGEEVYHNGSEFLLSVFFFGIMPVLAYVVHFIIPTFREKGRVLQRTMAFVLPLQDIWLHFYMGFLPMWGVRLQIIYCAYFFAVVILSVVNYTFKKKASGHACSFIELVIMLFLFALPSWVVLFIVIGMIRIWSSLYLKRHQPEELFWRGCCSVVAAILSVVLY